MYIYQKNIIWDKQTIFFIQGDWDVVVIQGQSQGQKEYDIITKKYIS